MSMDVYLFIYLFNTVLSRDLFKYYFTIYLFIMSDDGFLSTSKDHGKARFMNCLCDNN